jgi:hypothetical protein
MSDLTDIVVFRAKKATATQASIRMLFLATACRPSPPVYARYAPAD